MKNLTLSIAFSFFLLFSFAQDKPKKDLAEVRQIQNIYIFTYAKPIREYDYLGTVRVKACWECKAGEMVDVIIKKLKKEYPDGQGIIFTGDNMGEADVIKFKD